MIEGRPRATIAAAGLLALAGCAHGPDRYAFYPAAPADGQPYARASNAEPDTDSGDMSIACRPDAHRLEFTYYWASRGPVRTVDIRTRGTRRVVPVVYDPDGMGAAMFALAADDPAIAALRTGAPLALRYSDGHTIHVPESSAIRRVLALCS